MTRPLPVAVTRPKLTISAAVIKILVGLITFAINAWIVMVAANDLTSWHPGYWDAVLAAVAIRALQVPANGYLAWTHEAES